MKTVSMKRKIGIAVAALLAIVLYVAFAIPKPEVTKADTSITVRFYYNRSAADYTDWNVWMWAGSQSGACTFTGTDKNYGAYFDYVVEDESLNDVGFIIRKGEWEERDGDSDRYIDISTVLSGRVDVFVTQGKDEFSTSYTDATLTSKVKNITVSSKKKMSVELSRVPSMSINSAFKVLDANSNEVKISSASLSGTTATVNLASEIDYYAQYKLQHNGFTYAIITPKEYSSNEFESRFTYDGDDLGATWSKASTTFKVWAPTAQSVKVNFYKSGTRGTDDWLSSVDMTQGDKGVWSVTVKGDQKNKYYTYTVDVDGSSREVIDPYARTSGINGERAMVIDLDSTDPEGWDEDKNPHSGKTITDSVIYELHVKDFSWHESAGMVNKGKYIAFTEQGTTNATGQMTGIDYLKDLGITHVHLLPTNDFSSGDESGYWDDYCWGYDPKNYNIPDGMYSTDPYDGNVRIKEYKQMVKALHDAGIAVVNDVVFNHVAATADFSMNVVVPGYFIRPYSNGTGCGNDVASERSMVRKYIVDSIVYWAEEFHIDGFRFDLVGILDTQTINEIVEEVHKVDPSIILYGEGWDMYTNVTKSGMTLASQRNCGSTPGFAYFSDTMRDNLRGGNSDAGSAGFVNGNGYTAGTILESAYGDNSWAWSPSQVINYAACHDNYTLFDKILATGNGANMYDLVSANNLAAAVIMTSQGVPLFQAGEEILRSKQREDGSFDHNSYGSGPALNSIKYDVLNDEQYQRSYNYYKGLIEFRKNHAGLRMTNYDDVFKYMSTLADGNNGQGAIAYKIDGNAPNEISDGIIVIHNPDAWNDFRMSLPGGTWQVCVNKYQAGTDVIETVSGSVTVPKKSCMILVQGKTKESNVVVDSSITVHYQTSWSGANLYYWDVQPNCNSNTWPGAAMTSEGDGWFKHTIDNATAANVIFNYGSEQSADLSVTAGEWWYADGKWYSSKPGTVEEETTTEAPTTEAPTTVVEETTTEEETTEKETATEKVDAGIKVHFKSTWGGANVYFWEAAPATVSSSWPGKAMTSEGNNWYYYEFPEQTSINLIFNYNGNQTADLSRTTGEWWYVDGKWLSEAPEESGITVHFKSTWGGANIYLWDTEPLTTTASWPGVAMKKDGNGWYSYTISNVTSANMIFNYKNNQTADLSRTTGEWWYQNGKWYSSQP
jgi:pullulanase